MTSCGVGISECAHARVRLGEAGINYQDTGMKKLQGHELISVVEHYPDAIRYLAVDEKQ
jgi:hypothetical protein